MMNLRLFTLGALTALAAATAVAQEPVRVEYFYDSDPGYGKATAISGVQAGDNALQLDLGTLKPGSHLLCVRSQDSRGLWSTTVSRSIYVTKECPSAPVKLEYFIDADPGYGKGKALSVAEGESQLALDLTGTACGAHMLSLRVMDDVSNWSTVMARTIYVCEPRGFTALEYYFDNSDPGEGKGAQVAVPSEWDTEFTFDVDVEGLGEGDHYLCVRGKGQDGVWSVVSREPFYIQDLTGLGEVVFTMPLDIRAERSVCTVSGGTGRGDSRVEVFGVSGTVLATASWPASTDRVELPVSAGPGTVLVVKVTDRNDGRTLVRRVVMK